MRINPIANRLMKTTTRNLYDIKVQEAKSNLEKLNNGDLKVNAGEEVFVFSPGATSFGMFSNEFDRGNKYMAAVKNIF